MVERSLTYAAAFAAFPLSGKPWAPSEASSGGGGASECISLGPMRFVLFLAALAFAPAASAQDYEATPHVEVRRDSDGAGQAEASMDVAAPPSAVFALLTDCVAAQRYMRELLSCRVLERGQGWEVREHRVRGWPLRPSLRNVARVEMEPNRRLAFQRIDGDWSRSDGEWRLTPLDGGRGTRVEYVLTAALQGGLPSWLTNSRLRTSVRETLVRLRQEAERAP